MKKLPDPLKNYFLFVQISGIWLCSIFGALGAGIWLDKTLGTTPWLLLTLMILGTAFAMYTIYRTINQLK